MGKLVLFLAAILLVLPGMVNAAWGFGYWNNDFYIELQSGGYWHSEATPYTYRHDNWYYYDYPYRLYNRGTYNYYDAGWYNYGTYWANEPGTHYEYYPSNYYYYGGYWNYSPNWAYTYGPAYYGSWYYPCYNCGSDVGAPYSYPQLATCGEASLSAGDVSIVAGEARDTVVSISNNSSMNLAVKSVNVYVDSFDVTQKNLSFDKTIGAGSSGNIRFRLAVDNDAKTDAVNITVRVTGQFTDSTYCNSTDLGKETFRAYVSGKAQEIPVQEYTDPGAVSESHFEPKESEPRGWFEVNVETTPLETAVPVEEEKEYEPVGNCNAIGLNTEGITANANETVYTDFFLVNYSALDFYIDSVSVEEYSPNFLATGIVKDSTARPNNRARVGVKLNAFNGNEDQVGTAYATVKGHFGSGKNCTVKDREFAVYVKAGEEISLSGFMLNAPGKVKIKDSGYINISIDNPTEKDATIRVSGNGVNVSPVTINVPAMRLAERSIYVSGLSGETGFVTYNIELNGASFRQKYTKIERNVEVQIAGAANVELVSYEAEVELGENAGIAVVLRNESTEPIQVELDIINLPSGIEANAISGELAGGEEKEFLIGVSASELDAGNYIGYLELVFGGERIIRKIEFSTQGSEGNDASDSNGANAAPGNIVATGLVFLGNNAINFGLVIVMIILMYLLYKGITGNKEIVEEREKRRAGRKAGK